MRHPRERSVSPISRREFLQRSAGAAVAVPSLAAILAACTKPGASTQNAGKVGTGGIPGPVYPLARQSKPVTWNIFDDNQPIKDNLPIEKGATLKIYNWTAYLWTKVLDDFANKYSQYDVKWEYTKFNNLDNAVAKMNSGQLKFDIFFPTIDYIGKLVAAKLIQPLNKSYVPNLAANVWPQFQSPFYDVNAQYTVPYTVYTTGIAYRRDAVSDDTIYGMSNPYDILWDPKYTGRVGIYDSYRDALGMALLRNGITDVNTESATDIAAAGDALVAMIAAVNVRDEINGAYKLLPEGQFDLHESWSGDIAAGWAYTPKYTQAEWNALGYWYPKDRKGMVGNDLMVIPSNAEHPVLAHLFLDFMLDPTYAMENFSWVGYQPPQNSADPSTLTTTSSGYAQHYGVPYILPTLESAVVRPEDFNVGYEQLELSPDTDKLWHDAWQKFKAGG